MGFSRPEYWSGVPLPSPLLSLTHLFWSFFSPVLDPQLELWRITGPYFGYSSSVTIINYHLYNSLLTHSLIVLISCDSFSTEEYKRNCESHNIILLLKILPWLPNIYKLHASHHCSWILMCPASSALASSCYTSHPDVPSSAHLKTLWQFSCPLESSPFCLI